MPVKLNLLPENFQVGKGVTKIVKMSKSLSVITMVVFMLFSLGLGAYFIFSKITLDKSQKEVDQLKAQIKALEGSEQQLVLLKDRLAKISTIKSTPNALKNIVNFDSILANISSNSVIDEVNITSSKINTSYKLASNADFSTFISNLKNTQFFNNVDLLSTNFNPRDGYLVDFSLENK